MNKHLRKELKSELLNKLFSLYEDFVDRFDHTPPTGEEVPDEKPDEATRRKYRMQKGAEFA